MSKILVPHCIGCNKYKKENSIAGKNFFHWCYFFIWPGKNINYQELKTSPKWCPKRLGH